MRKIIIILIPALIFGLFSGCATQATTYQVVASTLPVYNFTTALCEDTGITVGRLISENVSCLHDYTLQTAQMRMLETSKTVVISGAGLESFLDDALWQNESIIDASANINLLHSKDCEDHHTDHSHEEDPHIWLSPVNAKIMAENICAGLVQHFPQFEDIFCKNLKTLHHDLDQLQRYGEESLSSLSNRNLITFHDGFHYFSSAFNLNILHAVEEEAGSEASAYELTELIMLVQEHDLPAVFAETNGSTSAASVIAAETGADIFYLDMAMSDQDYFDAMYHNIDTIKEALE